MTNGSDQAKAQQLSAPVSPTERIEALDIVRGLALFGVFLVNMYDFSGPFVASGPLAIPDTPWDQAAEAFIWIFGEGAFYSQFSLLFGIGLALQMTRAADRSERYGWRLASRLAVLACFGFAHTVLLWDGDILLAYALAGFLFLAFARVKPKTGLWLSLGFATISFLAMTLITTLVFFFDDSPQVTASEIQSDIDSFVAISYSERIADELSGWYEIVGNAVLSMPWFFAVFLVGSWLVKSGKVFDWQSHRPFLMRALKVSIPIALVAKGLIAVIYFSRSNVLAESFRWPITIMVGGPALGATYLCGTLLLLDRDSGFGSGLGRRVLGWFAPIGKMALTNYLLQSVMGVLIFRGYGFGLYGRVGLGLVVVMTICLFCLQVLFSRLWLQAFLYGPMEWLWRSLTYGKPAKLMR